MTERLPTVTARQLIRVLEQHGWVLHRTRGSHHHFVHSDRTVIITVPVHAKDLKRGLVAGVLEDARISREDFLRTLESSSGTRDVRTSDSGASLSTGSRLAVSRDGRLLS